MAQILDGNALSRRILAEVKAEAVEKRLDPGLAVIIVGDNPASRVYVDNKKKDCKKCGIRSEEFTLAVDAGEEKLLALIEELNNRPDIHGILVQLPLPPGYSQDKVIQSISPQKDVDAFHLFNVGRIFTGDYGFLPCTPAGVLRLLDEQGIELQGKHCVVVGHSNIVGKPMAMMFLNRNATVTICHVHTKDLKAQTLQADVLVVAVGKIGLITADMVKPGAVVVDVGINRTDSGICGDVDFEAVEKIAAYISPVPGGVGPMTRAMLMVNTLTAIKNLEGL